jgi:hypothetical protein
MMRVIGNHIHATILRAISAQAGIDAQDRNKPILIVEALHSVDWASATFVGARHEFHLRIEGNEACVTDAVDRLVTGIGEREIPIAGQIVAEIAVTLVNQDKRNLNLVSKSFTVNVLTIVD